MLLSNYSCRSNQSLCQVTQLPFVWGIGKAPSVRRWTQHCECEVVFYDSLLHLSKIKNQQTSIYAQRHNTLEELLCASSRILCPCFQNNQPKNMHELVLQWGFKEYITEEDCVTVCLVANMLFPVCFTSKATSPCLHSCKYQQLWNSSLLWFECLSPSSWMIHLIPSATVLTSEVFESW